MEAFEPFMKKEYGVDALINNLDKMSEDVMKIVRLPHDLADLGDLSSHYEKKNEEYNTRPAHYPPIAGVESIRIMETFNFNLGNAMKYIWRCGHKPGEHPVYDLKKAIQYLQFEIARIERGAPN